MNQLCYTDSTGKVHQLPFPPNAYLNLMEFIRDQGYEDWGDCRGRAWCASCHVEIISTAILTPMDKEESGRLKLMTNLENKSRLACQVLLNEKLHRAEVLFIGED